MNHSALSRTIQINKNNWTRLRKRLELKYCLKKSNIWNLHKNRNRRRHFRSIYSPMKSITTKIIQTHGGNRTLKPWKRPFSCRMARIKQDTNKYKKNNSAWNCPFYKVGDLMAIEFWFLVWNVASLLVSVCLSPPLLLLFFSFLCCSVSGGYFPHVWTVLNGWSCLKNTLIFSSPLHLCPRRRPVSTIGGNLQRLGDEFLFSF